MKNKKALVLAGGFPQIELIINLQRRGYFVLLADWNEEPVAKKCCDKYYQVSTLDCDAIKDIAVREKVDFIITVCTDQALLTVAKVSEELGLPCYIDYNTALNVTNKKYMKEVFVKNNIPTAKHLITDKVNLDTLKNYQYPLIVKPVDCNSSKGVAKAKTSDELLNYFEVAKKLSRTNTAIIEEFIEGQELSVDVYVDDGKAVVLDITNSEKIEDNSKFIINRTWHPAFINDEIKVKVQKVAEQISKAFGIFNSPMLIQMIERNNEVYVLEFSARTGGGVKFLSIKEMCGFDVIDAVIELTINGKYPLALQKPLHKYMIDEYVYCKPGQFNHLQGFDILKEKEVILDYYLFKWRGAVFDSISSSGDRIAGFTVASNSQEDLISLLQYSNDHVAVIDDKGQDIMRHDLILKSSIIKNIKGGK